MPKSLKDKSTLENQQYWAFVEKTAEEVDNWPAWKRGEPETEPSSEPEFTDPGGSQVHDGMEAAPPRSPSD